MLSFNLGQPIPKDKLDRIVQRLYNRPLTEVDAVYDTASERPKFEVGISQIIKTGYLETRLHAYERPNIKEAARIIATEGGVDVVILDLSQGDWIEGWDGATLGPYLLFKPDGSEHRARFKETPHGLPYGAILPWKDGLYLLD